MANRQLKYNTALRNWLICAFKKMKLFSQNANQNHTKFLGVETCVNNYSVAWTLPLWTFLIYGEQIMYI